MKMVIFHSYVSLPEGNSVNFCWFVVDHGRSIELVGLIQFYKAAPRTGHHLVILYERNIKI